MNWTRCHKFECPNNSHAKHCYDGGSCDKPQEKKKKKISFCHFMTERGFKEMLKQANASWRYVTDHDLF